MQLFWASSLSNKLKLFPLDLTEQMTPGVMLLMELTPLSMPRMLQKHIKKKRRRPQRLIKKLFRDKSKLNKLSLNNRTLLLSKLNKIWRI